MQSIHASILRTLSSTDEGCKFNAYHCFRWSANSTTSASSILLSSKEGQWRGLEVGQRGGPKVNHTKSGLCNHAASLGSLTAASTTAGDGQGSPSSSNLSMTPACTICMCADFKASSCHEENLTVSHPVYQPSEVPYKTLVLCVVKKWSCRCAALWRSLQYSC